MLTALSIFIIIVCVFLVIIVLVQNSKGGGLAQNFASTQQVMGVRKTTDFLEKATWTCAIVIMVLSFVSVACLPEKTQVSGKSVVDELINNQNAASSTQAFPAPAMDATDATQAPATEAAPQAE